MSNNYTNLLPFNSEDESAIPLPSGGEIDVTIWVPGDLCTREAYRLPPVHNPHIVCISRIILLVGVYAANLPPRRNAKFSIRSILDAALPGIHPIVAAGSNRCEAFKRFFGLTYEQMQQNNASVHEVLGIDLITNNGNEKYNLTETKRLKRVMKDACIIILIHGFMESSDGWMVSGIAPALLNRTGLKIFALDGRKVINWEYFRSSTYARFMGEQLGTCLGKIIKDGQDPAKISLIGHSLGAHIAGITGKTVHKVTGQVLGRITALDPAGPCFSTVSSEGRIDRTDAAYVDVIHTNGGVLGLKEPVGHKDFFPNGGMSQPGCILSTCDHSRSWEFLAESISSPKHFPARKCDNWTMFKDGLCTKNMVLTLMPGTLDFTSLLQLLRHPSDSALQAVDELNTVFDVFVFYSKN